MIARQNVHYQPVKSHLKVVGKRKNGEGGRWPARLPERFVGDYLVTPLTSAPMLEAESRKMNNSCRDYIRLCAAGRYLVFSVRSRSGERLATLGLRERFGSWLLDRSFAAANEDVLEQRLDYLDEDGDIRAEFSPTEIYYIAHDIVRLVNAKETCH